MRLDDELVGATPVARPPVAAVRSHHCLGAGDGMRQHNHWTRPALTD
jgi:hypothetical protein